MPQLPDTPWFKAWQILAPTNGACISGLKISRQFAPDFYWADMWNLDSKGGPEPLIKNLMRLQACIERTTEQFSTLPRGSGVMDHLEVLLIPMLDAIEGNEAGTAGRCGDAWTGAAGTGRAATAATPVGTSGCVIGWKGCTVHCCCCCKKSSCCTCCCCCCSKCCCNCCCCCCCCCRCGWCFFFFFLTFV